MKDFAIFFLVLSVLAIVAGLLIVGNATQPADHIIGTAMIGSGFTGILLSCAVIALADIRKAVMALVEESHFARVPEAAPAASESRPISPASVTKGSQRWRPSPECAECFEHDGSYVCLGH